MKNLTQILAYIGSVILLCSTPSISRAACPEILYASGPAELRVDPSKAVGSVLTSITVTWPTTLAGPCARGSYTMVYAGTGAVVMPNPTGGNLYDSGIPGIALRMKFDYVDGICSTAYWPVSCKVNNTTSLITGASMTVELVKTGPISGSGVLSGLFANWVTDGGVVIAEHLWTTSIVVAPIPTCAVTASPIEVPLGAVALSTLTGMDTTSPEKSFSIDLECSGGAPSLVTSVYVTLTDQTSPGNTSDILSLTPTSTAAGVGIQVLNGGVPVHYGLAPDVIGGDASQWFAGSAGNGTFTIPLTARYIRTLPVAKPGSANGVAIFTISYN
ncbi:fimbrial protein [Phenylobacterium sp.]|uniref:fimbrial protein n=1 Tax=Phenylobacterium sp. TaxID=1871053 RepID=UPI002F3F55A0